MRHYFIDRERSKDEFFVFEENYLNNNLKFKSCNDVFSKNEIDTGSKLLIETFINYVKKDKVYKVLDLGCGYGAISVNLQKHLNNINLYLSDVVETATNLAKHNLELNNVNGKVIVSNLYDDINEKFDYIVSNPPIKTGKALLFKFIEESEKHLFDGGELIVVIRKDLGMESYKKKAIEVFGNCEILKRNKGFYILSSCKKGD